MTLVDKAIWHLEMSLGDQITVDELARLSAVSRFHLMRVFRVSTGTSPMAYLRARRLSEAAKRIAGRQDDLLSVALSASYGSHEAFTRAFASYFNVLPSTVGHRASADGLTLMEPLQMKMEMLIDLDPPRIKDVPKLQITGPVIECTFENTSGIPALWQSFNHQMAASDLPGGRAFGVCFDTDEGGKFKYMAGVEGSQTSVRFDSSERIEAQLVSMPSSHIADMSLISRKPPIPFGTRVCRTHRWNLVPRPRWKYMTNGSIQWQDAVKSKYGYR